VQRYEQKSSRRWDIALTMCPDGESRQGRRNTTCIQQHMRTNLRTERVRLPIPGHLLSDKHPTLHKTKETADLWIASPDGRKWEEQKLAKYKKS
jgi:hypothetical protein